MKSAQTLSDRASNNCVERSRITVWAALTLAAAPLTPRVAVHGKGLQAHTLEGETAA
jgi:hypothetical protein